MKFIIIIINYNRFGGHEMFLCISPCLGKANRTLEESAREYQAKHENKTALKEVERITGEEEESNVLQVSALVAQGEIVRFS